MDDIYYLAHSTNNSDFLSFSELSINFNKISFVYNEDDQFPGIYFSLVTKQNINNIRLYPGKYILLFSKELLLQPNYHINFYDHNGMITEHNTYYPWDLDKFLEKQNNLIETNKDIKFDSEVVFHDSISMQYLCEYIEKPKQNIIKTQTLSQIQSQINKIYELLPRKSLTCGTINTNEYQKPFYCYPFEDTYPVKTLFENSSFKWLKMMAKVCDVETDETDSLETIRQKIRLKAKDIYNNREQQHFEFLKNYTAGKKFKNIKYKSKKRNKKTKRYTKLKHHKKSKRRKYLNKYK